MVAVDGTAVVGRVVEEMAMIAAAMILSIHDQITMAHSHMGTTVDPQTGEEVTQAIMQEEAMKIGTMAHINKIPISLDLIQHNHRRTIMAILADTLDGDQRTEDMERNLPAAMLPEGTVLTTTVLEVHSHHHKATPALMVMLAQAQVMEAMEVMEVMVIMLPIQAIHPEAEFLTTLILPVAGGEGGRYSIFDHCLFK